MHAKELEYLESLREVMEECGLDEGDISPRALERQGWEDAINRDPEDKSPKGWDSHIQLLVDGFRNCWTPQQVQDYAIKHQIWPDKTED